jgi:3-phosphoshikimate 1-carboxyvinyltransferase
MDLISKSSQLTGSVAIPASKSHTIRMVAIAALAHGKSTILNPLASSDTLSAAHCYNLLGAEIDTTDPTQWRIEGIGSKPTLPSEPIDVGNSGTTLRIAVGSAALAHGNASCVFTGDQQIQSRPIAPLLDALGNLGAPCKSVKGNGNPPVEVHGGYHGGITDLQAPTSQYLTSLLLCAPLAENDTEINVTLLNEPGYVDITLDWLDQQAIAYEHERLRHFVIKGNQQYKPLNQAVPADFSSATFFLCAAALFGQEVTLYGLDFSDSQPDKAVVDYLRAMGADITVSDDRVVIKGTDLAGTEIDMNATPDALPAMAVTGAFARGTTKLVNVPQARNKETDRIKCMAIELTKLGADVEELPDGLIIRQSQLTSAPVNGWHDHRIVMALAIAGFGLAEPITISTAEAMNVTFPNYVELMTRLGANLRSA